MWAMSTQGLDLHSLRHPKHASYGNTRKSLLVSPLATSSPARRTPLKLRRCMHLSHMAVRVSQGLSLHPSRGKSGFGTTSVLVSQVVNNTPRFYWSCNLKRSSTP